MISEILAAIASPTGLSITGIIAGVAIVIWDWRLMMVALILVQMAVGGVTVVLSGAPAEWILIQSTVMGLSCAILAISAARTLQESPSGRQSGSWWLRLVAILLMYGGWRLLEINVNFPETDANVAQLFIWLAACALLILGLGANPLFTGAALLLWIIPVQAFVATVLEIPSLVALVGILELLTALACSYLLIAERAPVAREVAILSDVAFPAQLAYERPAVGLITVAESISSTIRRPWMDRMIFGATTKSVVVDEQQSSSVDESPETGDVSREPESSVQSISQDEIE